MQAPFSLPSPDDCGPSPQIKTKLNKSSSQSEGDEVACAVRGETIVEDEAIAGRRFEDDLHLDEGQHGATQPEELQVRISGERRNVDVDACQGYSMSVGNVDR